MFSRYLAKINWYFKRLSIMEPQEFWHRLYEWIATKKLEMKFWQRRCVDRRLLEPGLFCSASTPQLPLLPWSFDLSAADAADIACGRWHALGFSWRWRDDPRIWSHAPDTGMQWPYIFFNRIPYRTGNPFGDARVVWEPARLQQLISLALLARQDRYHGPNPVAMLESILDSWVENNPPMLGIHYVSSMECALRLIAVCHALDMVRGKLANGRQTWVNLMRLVDSHARLISRRLSLYSSAGNHTIAEGAGLFYAGTLFPELPEADQWKSTGLQLLEHESARQILPDGGSLEQAFCYQAFIVDLLGLVAALVHHREDYVSVPIQTAVLRGRRFLNSFADTPGNLPRIGDSDDGFALSSHLRLSWDGSGLSDALIHFIDAGYTLVRRKEPIPFRLIFDHGHLGMSPSFGHGHADALSVMLAVGGHDLLIDSGTFTYTGEQTWRRWFRGTSAHNTVVVDGFDQAKQETAFQWSKAFNASLIRSESDEQGRIIFLARHNGYKGIGIIHWRGVLVDSSSIFIWDLLSGEGGHVAELLWHTGGCIRLLESGWAIEDDGLHAEVWVGGGKLSFHRGETTPPRGWRSSMYGIREPCTTARIRFSGAFPHEFFTHISVGRNGKRGEERREPVVNTFRTWISSYDQTIAQD